MTTTNDCHVVRSRMPDLLFETDFPEARPEFREHLASCSACSREWNELQMAVAMLDEWTTPEPSAYFDGKLRARLREAVAAPPEGLFERFRSFVLFSTGRQLRPALAGALALVLAVGGGSGLVGLRQHLSGSQASSAALNDLKVLDNNAQALQQMDQLLDESGADEGAPPTT